MLKVSERKFNEYTKWIVLQNRLKSKYNGYDWRLIDWEKIIYFYHMSCHCDSPAANDKSICDACRRWVIGDESPENAPDNAPDEAPDNAPDEAPDNDTDKGAFVPRRKERIECECGSVITRGGINRHSKTEKHITFINQLTDKP